MPDELLRGLKVLDLSFTPAGGFCSKLLAGHGADVVTVERRDAHLRLSPPFAADSPDAESSLVFWFLGLNKRSLEADIRSRKGRHLVQRLAEKSDIVLASFSAGDTASTGLAYPDLGRSNPGLIYVSLTPFGQTGPFAGYKADALVLDALSGTMFFRGQPGRPPLKMGGMVPDAVGGMAGFAAALTAVYGRLCTGRGCHVEVSQREALFALAEIYTSYYIYMGVVVRRSFDQMFLLPGRIRCKDGYVVPYFYGEAGWENFCLFLGQPDLTEDSRFRTFASRILHAEQLRVLVEERFRTETRKEIVARAQEWRLPFGYISSIEEALEDEGSRSRDFLRQTKHPLQGRYRYPGSPTRITNTRRSADRPPPLLGAQSTRVIADWLGTG